MDGSGRCTRSVVLQRDCSTLTTLNMDSFTNIQVLSVSSAFAHQQLQTLLLTFST